MATLNTGLWGYGGPLPAGGQQQWFEDGQKFGQVRWFMVHGNNNPGLEHRLEIPETFSLVKADGSRQINVFVRNVGASDFSFYAIFYAQTD
jgi:hypothetical protein